MASKQRKKVTQMDVARAAKVSQGVVSYILSGRSNGSLNVSDETRRRVLAVADKLGYSSVASASYGRDQGEGASVLFITLPLVRAVGADGPGAWVRSSYSTLYGRILAELTEGLSAHGLSLSIHHLTSEKELMQLLANSPVRGLVWFGCLANPSLLKWAASRLPVVTMNQSCRFPFRLDDVSVHQGLNVTIPAEYLWDKGHRKVAYFGHVPGSDMFERRLSAYRKFVTEKSIRNFSEFQEISDDQDRPADKKIHQILDVWQGMGDEAPTALILSDVFALMLPEAARDRGIRIPEDLSIVGVDNLDACEICSPKLTSMEESFSHLCEMVVERLIHRMDKPDAPSKFISVAPHLVERQSVRNLNSEEVPRA